MTRILWTACAGGKQARSGQSLPAHLPLSLTVRNLDVVAFVMDVKRYKSILVTTQRVMATLQWSDIDGRGPLASRQVYKTLAFYFAPSSSTRSAID